MTEERVNHPLFARAYIRMGSSSEEDEHRRKLLDGLFGSVIEVGAGNGLNFPFYPAAVERVLAVEPEPRMRAAAVDAAGRASLPVQVVDGVSGRLPAEDGSFDAGVASLVLCSVPDQGRALAELRRVIRPGGGLRFYEHVVASGGAGAHMLRIADLLWPRVAGGCHLSRDTLAAIGAAGFVVERVERFSFSPGALMPPIPHVLGVAIRP